MNSIKRLILPELVTWKDSPTRMPLLLRGARQVGKSYLIELFGRTYFKNMIVINFEESSEYIPCFESLKIEEIIAKIEILSNTLFIPGDTLLFLDEIQLCPKAISSLRYFKEKRSDLHVIGAGSLLEFALEDKGISIPVGRIQYLYLRPISFLEFLLATNNIALKEYLDKVSINDKIPSEIHQKALSLVREYMVIGGMPAVVDSYLKTKNFLHVQRLQTSILKTYSDDFGKYANRSQHPYLRQVFDKTPTLVGDQIKYVNISNSLDSRNLKQAIYNLNKAGVITSIYSTSPASLPFSSNANKKKFKLLFLDIGLMNRVSKLEAQTLMSEDIDLVSKGALAEQFVGSELLSLQDPYEDNGLYYWQRDAKNSSSEVDYVINIGDKIIPLEVKAGVTGRLKSLRMIMEEFNLPLGIKISSKELDLDSQKGILSIPFYLIYRLSNLL